MKSQSSFNETNGDIVDEGALDTACTDHSGHMPQTKSLTVCSSVVRQTDTSQTVSV